MNITNKFLKEYTLRDAILAAARKNAKIDTIFKDSLYHNLVQKCHWNHLINQIKYNV